MILLKLHCITWKWILGIFQPPVITNPEDFHSENYVLHQEVDPIVYNNEHNTSTGKILQDWLQQGQTSFEFVI